MGEGVSTKQGWLELDLGEMKRFDLVVIEEGWGRVQRFQLQVKENDRWRMILEGRTIGPHFAHQFPPVTVRNVRLNILEARDVPTVWEFQLSDRTPNKR